MFICYLNSIVLAGVVLYMFMNYNTVPTESFENEKKCKALKRSFKQYKSEIKRLNAEMSPVLEEGTSEECSFAKKRAEKRCECTHCEMRPEFKKSFGNRVLRPTCYNISNQSDCDKQVVMDGGTEKPLCRWYQ